jgi:DNA modification methylase
MITLDKKNVRTHPDANKAAIKNSLSSLGAGRSILIDADDVLIAGNGVFEQAEALGIPVKVIETNGKELIAVKRTDLYADDEKRQALAIADNRLTDLSEFDDEALNKMLDELSPDMQELAGYAIDPNDLMNEGLTDEDEVPEVTEATCKLGDLWILGNHRLLCGDSTDKEQVEKLMDGEKADMVFTDPPYGISVSNSAGGIKNDSNLEVYEASVPIIYSTLKDKSHAYLFFGSKLCMETLEILKKTFVQNNLLIMPITNQTQPYPEGYFSSNYEICFFSNKTELKVHNSGILPVSDVTKKDKRYNGDGFLKKYYALSEEPITEPNNKMVHPTQKKVSSICFYIEISSDAQDIIQDIFLGSGSTLIACEKTNRKCYGMELDPHYCDVIIKRWEDYTGESAVLDARSS